ncbi:MAG: hypothetical protein N4A71_13320 [Carboxylicivirga sp.]|nr:hypothetical protein [Carboxylicivirga sp.]
MNLLNLPYYSNNRINQHDPTFKNVQVAHPTKTIHVIMPEQPNESTPLFSYYNYCYSQVILFLNNLDKSLNELRNYQAICDELNRIFNVIADDQRLLTKQLQLLETAKRKPQNEEIIIITLAIAFLECIGKELTYRYPNYCSIPIAEINRKDDDTITEIAPLQNRNQFITPTVGTQIIDNLFSNLENVVQGQLQPSLLENRKKDFTDEKVVVTFNKHTYRLLYNIKFETWFDSKTHYYHDLLYNDCIRLRGELIHMVSEMQTNMDRQFIIDYIITLKLKHFLTTISQMLQGYSISLSDPYAKSNLYIMNLARVCLIGTYMEIQNHFSQFIPKDELVTIRSLYVDYNAGTVPLNTFVIRNRIKPLPKSFKYKGQDRNLNDFMTSLINNLSLFDQNTTFSDFKAIFSGEIFENKIIVKPNKNQLHYLIKSLYNHPRIECPENEQWYLASICFKFPNEEVERNKLRKAHKPTQEAMDKIDVAIKNL